MSKWTPADWTAFFGGIAVLIGAFFAGIVKVLAAVKEVRLHINSRMDELQEETRKASFAEGQEDIRALLAEAAGGTPTTRTVRVRHLIADILTASKINMAADVEEEHPEVKSHREKRSWAPPEAEE